MLRPIKVSFAKPFIFFQKELTIKDINDFCRKKVEKMIYLVASWIRVSVLNKQIFLGLFFVSGLLSVCGLGDSPIHKTKFAGKQKQKVFVVKQKQRNDKKRFLNSCLFFDSIYAERKSPGAICNTLEQAIRSESCYVFVQAHLLYLLYEKDISSVGITPKYDILKHLSNFNVYKFVKRLEVDGKYKIMEDREASLFLLIPEKYKNRVGLCGLKFDDKFGLIKKIDVSNYKKEISDSAEDLLKIARTAPSKVKRLDPVRALKEVFLIDEKSKNDFVWNIYQDGHGLFQSQILNRPSIITGLLVEDYKEELMFFNDHLNVNAFVLQSCFSGGQNWFIPYRSEFQGEIAKLKFPIVQIGSPDSVTFGFAIRDRKQEALANSFSLFTAFFNNLSSANKNIEMRLKRAVSSLGLYKYDEGLFANIPFVRFAGSQFFFPLIVEEIKDRVEYVSNHLIKKYKIEEKNFIEIDSSKKKLLMISPSNVSLPLHFINIKSVESGSLIPQLPAIVSLFPGSSIHFFAKLYFDKSIGFFGKQYPDIISLLLYKMFVKEIISDLKSQKIFIIKELVFRDFSVQNIVLKYSSEKTGTMRGSFEFYDNKQISFAKFDKEIGVKVVAMRDVFAFRKDIFVSIDDFIKNIVAIGFIEPDMEDGVFKLPSQYDYRPMFMYISKKLKNKSWDKKQDLWDFVWSRIESPDFYSDEKLLEEKVKANK